MKIVLADNGCALSLHMVVSFSLFYKFCVNDLSGTLIIIFHIYIAHFLYRIIKCALQRFVGDSARLLVQAQIAATQFTIY